EVAVVSASSHGVHLINLHSVEDDIDGVGEDTSGHTTEKAGSEEIVEAGHATGVLVDLIVEVTESPDPCGGVANSSCEVGIESAIIMNSLFNQFLNLRREILSKSTSSSVHFLEDLEWVPTSLHTEADEG